MKPLIQVQSISKQYSVGERMRYRTLRDTVSDFFKGRSREAEQEQSTFWALKDISFDVNRGDIVGIIGRNGAGKSTLLKILSRITTPTEGRAVVRGRVGSLLEIGTGFNPELTGRDNAFLNGAILGMRRDEIRRKFDDIVAFAGIEKFIDTPVKRYSSGMYVRLAFSVAAHMEQEILIIDEVLAVGDAEFQKKCVGKMHDLSAGGRTILFVSHNSSAVAGLCNRGIILEQGRVKADTSAGEALAMYARELNRSSFTSTVAGDRPAIHSIHLDEESLSKGALKVRVGFDSPVPLDPPIVGVVVHSFLGAPLFGTNARMHAAGFNSKAMSRGEAVLTIDPLPLHSGSYKISVWLGDRYQDYDSRLDALTFDYISPRFVRNLPPPEVIGNMDITGLWRLEGA